MRIELSHYVTGSELAEALKSNGEEMTYFLENMAEQSERATISLAEEVVQTSDDAMTIAAWLRSFADAIVADYA